MRRADQAPGAGRRAPAPGGPVEGLERDGGVRAPAPRPAPGLGGVRPQDRREGEPALTGPQAGSPRPARPVRWAPIGRAPIGRPPGDARALWPRALWPRARSVAGPERRGPVPGRGPGGWRRAGRGSRSTARARAASARRQGPPTETPALRLQDPAPRPNRPGVPGLVAKARTSPGGPRPSQGRGDAPDAALQREPRRPAPRPAPPRHHRPRLGDRPDPSPSAASRAPRAPRPARRSSSRSCAPDPPPRARTPPRDLPPPPSLARPPHAPVQVRRPTSMPPPNEGRIKRERRGAVWPVPLGAHPERNSKEPVPQCGRASPQDGKEASHACKDLSEREPRAVRAQRDRASGTRWPATIASPQLMALVGQPTASRARSRRVRLDRDHPTPAAISAPADSEGTAR